MMLISLEGILGRETKFSIVFAVGLNLGRVSRVGGIALIELNALRPTATVTDQHRIRPKSGLGENCLFNLLPSNV